MAHAYHTDDTTLPDGTIRNSGRSPVSEHWQTETWRKCPDATPAHDHTGHTMAAGHQCAYCDGLFRAEETIEKPHVWKPGTTVLVPPAHEGRISSYDQARNNATQIANLIGFTTGGRHDLAWCSAMEPADNFHSNITRAHDNLGRAISRRRHAGPASTIVEQPDNPHTSDGTRLLREHTLYQLLGKTDARNILGTISELARVDYTDTIANTLTTTLRTATRNRRRMHPTGSRTTNTTPARRPHTHNPTSGRPARRPQHRPLDSTHARAAAHQTESDVRPAKHIPGLDTTHAHAHKTPRTSRVTRNPHENGGCRYGSPHFEQGNSGSDQNTGLGHHSLLPGTNSPSIPDFIA